MRRPRKPRSKTAAARSRTKARHSPLYLEALEDRLPIADQVVSPYLALSYLSINEPFARFAEPLGEFASSAELPLVLSPPSRASNVSSGGSPADQTEAAPAVALQWLAPQPPSEALAFAHDSVDPLSQGLASIFSLESRAPTPAEAETLDDSLARPPALAGQDGGGNGTGSRLPTGIEDTDQPGPMAMPSELPSGQGALEALAGLPNPSAADSNRPPPASLTGRGAAAPPPPAPVPPAAPLPRVPLVRPRPPASPVSRRHAPARPSVPDLRAARAAGPRRQQQRLLQLRRRRHRQQHPPARRQRDRQPHRL